MFLIGIPPGRSPMLLVLLSSHAGSADTQGMQGPIFSTQTAGLGKASLLPACQSSQLAQKSGFLMVIGVLPLSS